LALGFRLLRMAPQAPAIFGLPFWNSPPPANSQLNIPYSLPVLRQTPSIRNRCTCRPTLFHPSFRPWRRCWACWLSSS
jgi:hypothetical protein